MPKRNERPVSLERLKELLHYDPETGLFTWLQARGRVPAGALANALNARGYIQIQIDGFRYTGHQLAWFYVYGDWPPHGIDHRNLAEADNRLVNLRLANQSQNMANGRLKKSSTTGFKGVSERRDKRWPGHPRRWCARIMVGRQRKNLGQFTTPEAASAAYQSAAQQYFGEFARVA